MYLTKVLRFTHTENALNNYKADNIDTWTRIKYIAFALFSTLIEISYIDSLMFANWLYLYILIFKSNISDQISKRGAMAEIWD